MAFDATEWNSEDPPKSSDNHEPPDEKWPGWLQVAFFSGALALSYVACAGVVWTAVKVTNVTSDAIEEGIQRLDAPNSPTFHP